MKSSDLWLDCECEMVLYLCSTMNRHQYDFMEHLMQHQRIVLGGPFRTCPVAFFRPLCLFVYLQGCLLPYLSFDDSHHIFCY